MKDFPREILISPDYGAGWSSWENNRIVAQFVAEYKPIINYLKKNYDNETKEFKKLVDELKEIVLEKFGRDFYTGGAKNLKVVDVYGPYRIVEYDGAESIEEREDNDLWFY